MIKINLRPHRISNQRPQKRASIRVHLAIGVSVMLLSVTSCWLWGSSLLQQRDDLQQKIISKEEVLAPLVVNNQEGEKFRATQDRLMAYTEFLARNAKQKNFSIFALDEISRSLEPLGIWLIALSVDHHSVVIEGKALSRKDIGKFIGNLEEAAVFGNLIRMEAQPHDIIQGKVTQRFSLQFTTQI